MIPDNTFYALAAFAVLIIGISKSGFGTGLGVLGVPLMALVIPPSQAAAILLPLHCILGIINVVHYRTLFDRKTISILLPAALLGIVIGALSFRFMSDAHIRVLLGIISVIFAANYLVGLKNKGYKKSKPTKFHGNLWGTIAGFTSFSVHAGALPLNIYLIPQRMDKSVFVGTSVVLFTILNFVKLIPYALLGQLNGSNLLISLSLIPIIPLGFGMGIFFHKRVNERQFYILAILFFLVAGLKLLYEGIMAL